MATIAFLVAVVAVPYWEISSLIKKRSQACDDIAAQGGHVRWLMWSPKYIDLTGAEISDESLRKMSSAFDQLPTVEQVRITNTSVTPDGVLKLRRLRGVNLIALITTVRLTLF